MMWVKTLTQLASLNADKQPNYKQIFVATLRDSFKLNRVSNAIADGYTVVQPSSGTGKWIRENISDGYWMTQKLWYIDPINGGDENTGADVSHPIKTDRERQLRMGPNAVWSAGLYEVFYMSDIPLADFVHFEGTVAGATQIILHGSATRGAGKTVLYTSVAGMTARVAQNRSANTRGTITDAAVPTGTWSGANLLSTGVNNATANKRIRLTDGAIVGSYAFAQKDLTAGQVAVSQWMVPPNFSTFITSLPTTEGAPTGNEHFVVESLTNIASFAVDLKFDGGGAANGGIVIVAESLDFSTGISGTSFYISHPSAILLIGCTNVPLSTVTSTIVLISSHLGTGAFVNGGCRASLYATHHTSVMTITRGGWAEFDFDAMSQGSPLIDISGRSCGSARIGTAAAFDSASDGFIFENCPPVQNVPTGLMWGTGNVGYGINVHSGACLVYSNTPIVNTGLGAGREIIIGGIDKLLTDLPYSEDIYDAKIVARA